MRHIRMLINTEKKLKSLRVLFRADKLRNKSYSRGGKQKI
jgi:hypothetical protein